MHRKKRLDQWKHPFHSYPFEALTSGSWQAVELIKIESGTTTLHFIENHHMTFDKGLFSDVRTRSRKATSSDCSFLRTGMDICVLSAPQCGDNSDNFNTNHMWVDAKISSIQRKPHNPECSCQYYVNPYFNQGSLGTEIRTLRKVVKVVGINEIAILQKLERNSCEDQYYRWESSKDCYSVPHTKFLSGKFVSDLSWLVVTSSLKNISFYVRSVENKIVYQIFYSYATSSSLNMNSGINVVNFEVDKEGTFMPIMIQVDVSDTNGSDHKHDSHNDVSSLYGVEGLRRSKRRNKQPERYSGCGNVSEIKVGNVRTWPYKLNKRRNYDDEEEEEEEEEESLPLAQVSGSQQNCAKEDGDNSKKLNEVSSCQAITVYCRRNKNKEVKSCEANQDELQTQLDVSAPLLEEPPSLKRMRLFGLEDDLNFGPGRGCKNFNKGVVEKRHSSWYSSSRSHNADMYKDRSLNATVYKEMIDSYLKGGNTTSTKEEPPVSNLGQNKESEITQRKDEEEISEIDMLWREMEMALASNYLEGSNGADSNYANFAENMGEVNHICQHDFNLNEEVGTYCFKCGFVETEIKYITPPFLEKHHLVRQKEKKCSGKEAKAVGDGFHLFSARACCDELISMEHDNVWRLIPQLIEKMHIHQKKAFEFVWQNIGGSMEPSRMDVESKRRGGCVISHAPGAGKSFLAIAFLISYLKLFPGKKPLVLAPKTTLHTWHKEFIKWEISMPVYLIHGCGGPQKDNKQNSIVLPGFTNPNKDIKHVLDCLDKIKKCQSHPSVLVVSYTSFLALMREGSEFAHRKYMSKALRQGPGILILDEGHNPRSNKSRLRKGLMKVETDLRILLSGTLFQNNFCEYFNTLCLARPKFIYEVLNVLDSNHRRRTGKTEEKARHLLEARARKLFLDKIAMKIDSRIGEERMQGLNMLREITNGFIDVYDSTNFESLPGLQIYTLLMNTSDMQREILLKLQNIMAKCNGYPLELELLVTLGSIHPWLVKTATWANKFFSLDQLKQLEKSKFDLKIGSKVKFVLSLVVRVMEKEKVLIFCHNLAPVKLLVELFEMFFKWEKIENF